MTLKDFSTHIPSENIKLSVIIMADSFFYCIFDGQDKILVHQSFTDLKFSQTASLHSILSDKNLQLTFQKISVMVVGQNSYFSTVKDDGIVDLLPGLEHKSAYFEELVENKLYNYFSITSHQENLINQLFSDNYLIRSFSSVLFDWYRFNDGNIIHIHKEANFILLYIQKENLIHLSNYFMATEMNDIVYFFLSSCKENNINLANDRVIVSGDVEENSPLFTSIKSYVGDVHLVELDGLFGDNNIEQSFHAHHYFLHNINIA